MAGSLQHQSSLQYSQRYGSLLSSTTTNFVSVFSAAFLKASNSWSQQYSTNADSYFAPAKVIRWKIDEGCRKHSKLAISLNVANFKPEELSVDLDARILKVQEQAENPERKRPFLRQWMLPNDVDEEQLKFSLTEDGHLPEITKKSSTSRSI